MSVFRPPTDWEPVYAASATTYTFGEDPSQIATTAVRFFRALGGSPQGARALDLGSGEGRDTAFLAAQGFHVHAIDIAPSGLEKTRGLLARRGISASGVTLELGDVRAFDYPHEAYDIAIAANVYQFLLPADVPGHIARLKDAVRPGGICGVGVFHPAMREWGADIGNCYAATADELRAFFTPEREWRLLDRTEYWTYRQAEDTMASFAYVIAHKLP